MSTHYRTAEYEDTIEPSLLERRLPKRRQRTLGRRGHPETENPLFITQSADLRKASVVTDVTWESNSDILKSSDEEDDVDHKDKPRRLAIGEVMKVLYEKECKKLGVCPVGAFLRAPNKSSLTLRNYSIGPKGAAALAVPLLLDSFVTAIDLEGNAIEAAGLASLAGVLLESNYITNVNLANNKLGREGCEITKQLLMSNFYITHVNVSENKFTDMDADTFALIIRENKHLKELLLSKNEFGEYSGKIFGPAIASNDNLETLDLSWNQLRGKGAIAIAHALKENVGLKTLNLSFNGFGAEGATAMGGALASNRTLRELDLSHNRIVDGAIKDFASGLAANDGLETLKIGYNALTQPSALAILEGVKRNDASALAYLDLQNISVTEEFLAGLDEIQKVKQFNAVFGLKSKIPINKPEPVPKTVSEHEESEDVSDILDEGNEEQTEDGEKSGVDYYVAEGHDEDIVNPHLDSDNGSDKTSARNDTDRTGNEEASVKKDNHETASGDDGDDKDEKPEGGWSREHNKESGNEIGDHSAIDGNKEDDGEGGISVNAPVLQPKTADGAAQQQGSEESVNTVMEDDDDDDLELNEEIELDDDDDNEVDDDKDNPGSARGNPSRTDNVDTGGESNEIKSDRGKT